MLKWSNLIWASPEPREAADRLCLLALADHANEKGFCWPSQARLGRKCGVSKRAIQYTLGRLEAGGYIRVEHRSGRPSLYWILEDALTPEAHCQGEEGVTHEAHCGGTDEADCVAPPEVHCQPPTKPTATEPPMNHQLEPPTEPLVSVGSENGVGMKSVVFSVVAQLRTAGEMDADLEAKVASLVGQYGPDLVTRQCDALACQYAGQKFGFGLLIKAVKQPDSFNFSVPAPVAGPTTPARPVPGTSRTIEEAAALNAAGVTSPDDWQNRDDFLRLYVPHEVHQDGTASSIPSTYRNVLGGDRATHRGKSGPLATFLQPTQNGGDRLMAAPKNPATHVARQAKKAKAQAAADAAGSLDELRCKLWRCLDRVERILGDEEAEPTLVLKAAHCLSQVGSTYIRLVEGTELEKRLDALEKGLETRGTAPFSGAYA